MVSRWTVAILTAACGLLLAPATPVLVDATPCGGLFSAITIASLRLRPDTPAAFVVGTLNGVIVFVALLLFWHLARRATSSSIAATIASLAFASTSVFARAFATTPAAGVLTVSLACHACLARWQAGSSASNRDAAIALGAVILTSLTIPPLSLAIAIAIAAAPRFAWPVTSSATSRGLIAGGVIVAGVIGLWLVPQLGRPAAIGPESRLSCLTPDLIGDWNPLRPLRSVLFDVGPAAIVAAMLGVFYLRSLWRSRLALGLAALALLPMVVSAGHEAEPRLVLTPTWIAFWLLAGCGVCELLAALHATAARRIVAMALAAMLPLLQVSRSRAHEPDPRDRVRGHEQMTATSMARILGVIPPRGVLVVDDALTDLLARSHAGTTRLASGNVIFVKPDASLIETMLPSHRVLALPRAQYVLGHSAFRLETDFQPRVNGVARVVSRMPCGRIRSAWSEMPELIDATRFAFVVDGAPTRETIVAYLGLDEYSEPRPLDWPRDVRRRFGGATYDRNRPSRMDDLNVAREIDGASASAPIFAAPIVVRLELSGAPSNAAILPVDIATPIRRAMVRGPRDASIVLCPSWLGGIEPLR
jgi:hypothetical protein